MLTLTISEETLKAGFDAHLKQSLDRLIGYSGDKEIKQMIDDRVRDFVKFYLDSTDFKLALGTAMATEIAKKQLDKLK